MKKNINKKKKRIKILLIVCTILILLLLIIIVAMIPKDETEEDENLTIITEEEKEEVEKNVARALPEKQRIEYYIASYVKNIERGEYKKNYDTLADKFKQNYFPTYEKYIEYVKKTYSSLTKVQYNDMQRQGNYYILDITITNLGDIQDEITQKFVIYEESLMSYKLSFQVK